MTNIPGQEPRAEFADQTDGWIPEMELELSRAGAATGVFSVNQYVAEVAATRSQIICDEMLITSDYDMPPRRALEVLNRGLSLRLTEERRGRAAAETLATIDPLTGCLNRRGLERAFARHMGTAGTAVIFLDADDFKQVNERHGHVGGDQALRQIVHKLEGALRPSDVIGRYGGDEFVILATNREQRGVHNATAHMARHVSLLQRLHAATSRRPEGNTPYASVSYAAADMSSVRANTGSRTWPTLEDAVALLKDGLEAAKSPNEDGTPGKNTVCALFPPDNGSSGGWKQLEPL